MGVILSCVAVIRPLGDNPGVQTKARNYQIVARLQQDNAALFGPRPLYDGGSLLYSLQHLQGSNTVRDISVSQYLCDF